MKPTTGGTGAAPASPPNPLSPDGWPRLRRDPLLWIVVALAIGLGISAVERTIGEDTSTDFNNFWDGGRAILHGADVREIEGLRRYLPFFPIMMAPFGLVPMPVAAGLWHLVEVASILGLFWLTWRMLDDAGTMTFRRALIAAGLATAAYWWDHFVLCQINGPATFLALLGFRLASRGRPWSGGLAVAVGTSIKIFPGIVFLVFLFTRQWKAAAGFVLGFALCCAASLPLYGPKETIAMHKDWVRDGLLTAGGEEFIDEGRSIRYTNASLLAVLTRTMTHANAGRTRKPMYVNVADVEPATVERTAKVLQLILLAALAAICLRAGRPRVEHAAFALAMTTFFVPVAWTFHLVVIVPACVVLAGARDPVSRRFLWATALMQLAVVSPYTRAVGGLLLANLAALAGVWRLGWLEARRGENPAHPGL